MTKEEILEKLAYVYSLPSIFKWISNGTSIDFIRGYQIAIEHVCKEFDIKLSQLIKEINK